MLAELAADLRQALGILHKQDIQTIAHSLGHWVPHAQTGQAIWLGDDCAAIPDGESYLLLAAEGMLPKLVREDPWFAGWCSVLVNVSDIYAMGGRPIAVVDALWSRSATQANPLRDGMIAAAQCFNVPIVGGHTNCHSDYDALSVAILGRATHLITSFDAQPGDRLLLVANVNGQPHPRFPLCWDAATTADPATLRQHLEQLPQLAEAGLCRAGKDISMGGLIGTALMLLETSRCGAILEVDQIPVPVGLALTPWLLSFPSYGFLLSASTEQVPSIQQRLHPLGLVCEPIGTVTASSQLVLSYQGESLTFWDFEQADLTGFGQPRAPESPARLPHPPPPSIACG